MKLEKILYKLTFIFSVLLILGLVSNIAYAGNGKRIESISQTKQAVNNSLDILVPYAENVNRKNIQIRYYQEVKRSVVASIGCFRAQQFADIRYDNVLIFMWRDLGQVAVSAVIAHELAHCSTKNQTMRGGQVKREYHADELGFDIFYKAGYNPQDYLKNYRYIDSGGDPAHASNRLRILNLKRHAKQKYGLELK